jgi:hypothetical protein
MIYRGDAYGKAYTDGRLLIERLTCCDGSFTDVCGQMFMSSWSKCGIPNGLKLC